MIFVAAIALYAAGFALQAGVVVVLAIGVELWFWIRVLGAPWRHRRR
ncbi:MAG: hypothetical protein AAF513_05305 [Pseudomonadota bacterium]